jgi:hypothetical protein
MINIVSLLHVHVLTTLVAILRDVSRKGYITRIQEPMHKCKTSFKIWSEIQFRTSLHGIYHTDNLFTYLLQYIILSTNVQCVRIVTVHL